MQNIHPMFIHFPIAFLSVALLFDLLGQLFKKESLSNAGWWCQFTGVISIIAAVTTGFIAEDSVSHNEVAHSLMETHETIAIVVTALFSSLFIWRLVLKGNLPSKTSLFSLYMVVNALLVVGMLYGAHLGGKLVFDHGVGTSVTETLEIHGAHDHSVKDGKHSHGIVKKKKAKPAKKIEKATKPQSHRHKNGKGHKP